MKKTKGTDRRMFLSATGGALIAAGSAGALKVSGQHHKASSRAAGGDPLGSATVGFGGWMTPLDRFKVLPAPAANHHELIPYEATIKAGGYVNFVISGLHVVSIYDDGTSPAIINTGSLVTGRPPGTPPIIDSPTHRIYRGIDPVFRTPTGPSDTGAFNLDRVEVVHFDQPGTYLVICAVLPHFLEGMYGYVRVLPG